MASFATPQRPARQPASPLATPVIEKASPAAALPAAQLSRTAPPARLPHGMVDSRPLVPIPLFRPDAPATPAPLPLLKQSPLPVMPPTSEEEWHADAREAVPAALPDMAQPRIAVKQARFPSVGQMLNAGGALPVQRKNVTGLPDALKAGIEGLSGIMLDDVRVRYNSPKAAEIGALAYAQGREIHIGPGQEQHLPHEVWHVVQQQQGRVRATVQIKGAAVNDDAGLEAEADTMGARAARSGTDQGTTGQETGGGVPSRQSRAPGAGSTGDVIQGMFWEKTPEGKYIWHYGPVIPAFWQAAPDEPYSHPEGTTAYGVWLRKSALPSAEELAKEAAAKDAAAKDAAAKDLAAKEAAAARVAAARVAEKDAAAKGSVAPPKQDSADPPKKAVEEAPKEAVGEPPMDAGAPIKEGAVIEPVRKVVKLRDPLSLEKIQAGVKARPKNLGETLMQYAVRVANELSAEYSLNIQDHDWIFPKVKGAAIIYFPLVDQGSGGQDAIGATVNYKGTAYQNQTPLIQQLADEYGLEKKTTKTALSRMVSGGKGNNDLKRTGPAIKDDTELVMLRGALHESFGIGENGCTFFFLKTGANITIVAVGAHVGDAKHYRLEYGATGYPSKGAFMFP